MDKYIITSFVAFMTTLIATPLVIRLALRFGAVDRPGERRIHYRDTPRGGGLAIILGFHTAFAVFVLFGWEQHAVALNLGWWKAFLAASAVLMLVGLVDDVKGVRPWFKLAGQTAAALVMYHFGARFGSVVAWEVSPALDMALTVFWFLAITNAFNLIDGLDGLASGLALISCLGLVGALFFRRMSVDAVVMMMLAASCLAFLRYNFHPAKVFLGDTGSMFLGFTLAAFALATSSKGTFTLTVGVALLAMGIPVFDTLLAIWRRSVRMLSPRSLRNRPGGLRGLMDADNEHLHHRLLENMSQRQVATLLFGVNAIFVLLALAVILFRTHALGIFLLAFVIGTYVVVRHLAHVELWDTGAALVQGLHRPKGRVFVYLLYPLLDVALLTLVLAGTMWLMRYELGPEGLKLEKVLAAWPVWVAPVFISLFLGKVYARVWSKARMLDYIVLMMAVMGGSLAGFAVNMLTTGTGLRQGVLMALVFGGVSHLLLSSLRMFGRGLRDLMSWFGLSHHQSRRFIRTPVLLYGTGPRLGLFLRERAMGEVDEASSNMYIVGIMDDDPNLRRRLVNGYRVLGGLEVVSELVQDFGIKRIYLLDDVSPQVQNELQGLAEDSGLALIEWHYTERVITPASSTLGQNS